MLKYSARDYIASCKQPASRWLNPRPPRGRFNISWLCTRKGWIENIRTRLENALAGKRGGSSRLVNPSIIQTRGLKVRTCKREELKTEPPCARCFFLRADHKLIYLHSAPSSAVWSPVGAAVTSLDWNLGTQDAMGPI